MRGDGQAERVRQHRIFSTWHCQTSRPKREEVLCLVVARLADLGEEQPALVEDQSKVLEAQGCFERCDGRVMMQHVERTGEVHRPERLEEGRVDCVVRSQPPAQHLGQELQFPLLAGIINLVCCSLDRAERFEQLGCDHVHAGGVLDKGREHQSVEDNALHGLDKVVVEVQQQSRAWRAAPWRRVWVRRGGGREEAARSCWPTGVGLNLPAKDVGAVCLVRLPVCCPSLCFVHQAQGLAVLRAVGLVDRQHGSLRRSRVSEHSNGSVVRHSQS